jgi:hypothetical protein
MHDDDPLRAWWSSRKPVTLVGADEPPPEADPDTPRPDPASLHAGAMPYYRDEPADPIRAWLDGR